MERYGVAPNSNGTAPSSISLPPKPLTSRPRRADDNDISIFDAQRYFNDTGNDAVKRPWATSNPRDSSASSINGFGHSKSRSSSSFHATPTASSEASWNSQTGLLTNIPGSLTINVRATESPARKRTTSGRRLFSYCPCSGKKSVDVEESYHEPKTPVRAMQTLTLKPDSSPKKEEKIKIQITENAPPVVEEVTKLKIVAGSWSKEENVLRSSGRFSQDLGHRILNPTSRGVAFSFPVLPPIPAAEEPPRDSLEVFRPSELTRKSLETHHPAVNSRRSFTVREEDAASDASSDLFEIESFSTHRQRESFEEMTPARRRSIGEATPSIAPSECYAPSEVSVEWSVTTAEGYGTANFSSAASEYDELRFIGEETDRFAAEAGGGGARKKGNGLLSCVCEKAVSVGPNPVRCGAEEVDRMGGGRAGRLVKKRLVQWWPRVERQGTQWTSSTNI